MCWSLTPGVFHVPISRSQCAASSPASSASSRRAVASSDSSSLSRVPAGISSTMSSTAARYWRTSVTVPSSCSGDHGHRAGVADHEAVERVAVGVDQMEAVDREQPRPQELLLRDTAEARARHRTR